MFLFSVSVHIHPNPPDTASHGPGGTHPGDIGLSRQGGDLPSRVVEELQLESTKLEQTISVSETLDSGVNLERGQKFLMHSRGIDDASIFHFQREVFSRGPYLLARGVSQSKGTVTVGLGLGPGGGRAAWAFFCQQWQRWSWRKGTAISTSWEGNKRGWWPRVHSKEAPMSIFNPGKLGAPGGWFGSSYTSQSDLLVLVDPLKLAIDL